MDDFDIATTITYKEEKTDTFPLLLLSPYMYSVILYLQGIMSLHFVLLWYTFPLLLFFYIRMCINSIDMMAT
jgi:hypothetical protein